MTPTSFTKDEHLIYCTLYVVVGYLLIPGCLHCPFRAAIPIKRLVLRYATGGPGTPFLRYNKAVRQCVAIKAPNTYLSNPGEMPSFAHLKHKRAGGVSLSVLSIVNHGMNTSCNEVPICLSPTDFTSICSG
jgi:hypothetical protein